MRVHVDLGLCKVHALCVVAAPEVFTLDDRDELVFDASPDDGQWPVVEAAARACPVQAILLAEQD